MTGYKIGVIGTGNIAGALLNGMIASGTHSPESIVVYDILPEKYERFTKSGCSAAQSECALAKECDTIILAVKPQGFPELLEKISGSVDESKLIVSVAAGISIDDIIGGLGKTVPVVRVLPNTPMLIGLGVSAITCREPVTEEQYEFVCDMFRSCGEVYFVPEDSFDSIICVHSSSPAYFFAFARAMVANAEKQGIDHDQALKMITGTMLGAAKMIEQSGMSCDQLIQMVCSKGGTTEASMKSFAENGFDEIVAKAMEACTKRAKELGGKN